jgi:STE24 endopeptidase
MRRLWWIPASIAFVALFALFAFVGPYLVPDLREVRGPQLRADAQRLAEQQGLGDVPVRVEEVHEFTSAPNAYAMGMGPSEKVVLWDTIIDFPRPELRVVLAHEFAHLSKNHIAKQIGLFALFVFPAAFLVAFFTRKRGGLYEPTAVPLALIVLVLVTLVATPLMSAVSRRYEAESDWTALQQTRDPRAMQGLFVRFTERGLADPDPPGWWHTVFDSHPSGLERLAMGRAWAQLHSR